MTLAGLLGLARAAGALRLGAAACEAGLKQGRIAALLVAADASERTRRRFTALAAAGGVPIGPGPASAELGRLVGHSPLAVVGFEAGPFARPAIMYVRQVRGRPIEYV